MNVDSKNLLRVDIVDIYKDCKNRTNIYAMAQGLDVNKFTINSNTMDLVHTFAIEGSGLIADKSSMVKSATQSGFDALTFDEELDDQEETDEDGLVIDQMGENLSEGEKLTSGIMDLVLFEIEDVRSEWNRYTVVQNYIKTAMVHYILYKYYATLGMMDAAAINKVAYEENLENVKYNSVRNHERKKACKPYRLY